MKEAKRLAGMAVVLGVAAIAWMVLGGVMSQRTSVQRSVLADSVADLWGVPMTQSAPVVLFEWDHWEEEQVPVTGADGERRTELRRTLRTSSRSLQLQSSDIAVDLSLDPRRKGLVWFALYDVVFGGEWTVDHEGGEGRVVFRFPFPNDGSVYDDFRLTVNGEEQATAPQNGAVTVRFPVSGAEQFAFEAEYRSRGADSFHYLPSAGSAVSEARELRVAMTTDFEKIDFPPRSLSPSTRERTDAGWELSWDFRRIITGHGIGMVMPQRIQPGPLAASMAFSAPISLALFMLWIYVLGLLKEVEIHPVNHLLVAGSFFGFHLLFGYSVDHLSVLWAFLLCSVVSMVLTVSYLRLVAGPRFAVREAGIAQLVYLVGFALAHFFDGFTGLTLTVIGIGTLFAVMQLTGRVRWSEVFAPAEATQGPPPPR